jgi:flagellar biosynthetic protein FlhB
LHEHTLEVADAERTHDATPKRKQDFRKKGDIALSRDLVSTATMAGAIIALVMFAGRGSAALLELTRNATTAADGRDTSWLAGASVETFITCVAPALVGASVFALVSMFGQLGWPPAFKKIGFDFNRMNPITNIKSTFAVGAVAKRTGSAVAKLIVVGAVVFLVLKNGIGAHAMGAGELGEMAWKLVKRSLLVVLSVMVAIAAVDYFLARRRINEQMKMSADEVKREHKESEGDPMIKGKRKQRMRELAKRRMAKAVATADVIVVNPTHYSVALRYDENKDRAPVVVAKGVDEQAAKIREIARAHGVPVMSRPPLARALHKHVKEGAPIPANLFKAVAEVLAYVYRIKRGGAA